MKFGNGARTVRAPEPPATTVFLRSAITRGILMFSVGAITETLQYFGVPIFGQTFDPYDYLMFALGIGLAYVFERTLLPRITVEEPLPPDGRS